jgi:hypothetical protein
MKLKESKKLRWFYKKITNLPTVSLFTNVKSSNSYMLNTTCLFPWLPGIMLNCVTEKEERVI